MAVFAKEPSLKIHRVFFRRLGAVHDQRLLPRDMPHEIPLGFQHKKACSGQLDGDHGKNAEEIQRLVVNKTCLQIQKQVRRRQWNELWKDNIRHIGRSNPEGLVHITERAVDNEKHQRADKITEKPVGIEHIQVEIGGPEKQEPDNIP